MSLVSRRLHEVLVKLADCANAPARRAADHVHDSDQLNKMQDMVDNNHGDEESDHHDHEKKPHKH